MRASQRTGTTASLAAFLLWSVLVLQKIQSIEAGKAHRFEQEPDPDQRIPPIQEVRRAPKPEFDASTGATKYELLYQRTNQETGEHTSFSYTSVRNNDLIIWLDDIEGVFEVECGSEVLTTLKVSESCSLIQAMEDWRTVNGQGFLIYGGAHWGCLGPGKDRSPLFRVQTGPRNSTRLDSENFTLSIPTEQASPFAFFGRSRFSFTSNESLLDTGGLRRTLHELSNAHETKPNRKGQSHRRAEALWGQFPSDGSEWGYGTAFDLINWNYDVSSGRAKQENFCFFGSPGAFDSNGLRSCCNECYVYAGVGIGFEFETEAFDLFPTYLLYMKLWVGATATYNVDLDLEAETYANSPFVSGSGFNNVLTQTGERDIPFRDNSFTAEGVDDLLPWDLTFFVAGIEVNINFRMPVFLQWGITTSSGGRAWVGSHYRASEVYGIAWLNQARKNECQMSGCQELAATCLTEWCEIRESTYEEGSSGPYWTFKGPVTAQIVLTPILITRVWGGSVSGFVQLDAIATVTGTVKNVYENRNVEQSSFDFYGSADYDDAATALRGHERQGPRYAYPPSDFAIEPTHSKRVQVVTGGNEREPRAAVGMPQLGFWGASKPTVLADQAASDRPRRATELQLDEIESHRLTTMTVGWCSKWSSEVAEGQGKYCCDRREDCGICGVDPAYYWWESDDCYVCLTATCDCEECPEGYWRQNCFQDEPGSCSMCESCPAGQHRSNCSGVSPGECVDCQVCGQGTYRDSECVQMNAGSCQACPEGTNTRNGIGEGSGIGSCICDDEDAYADFRQGNPCRTLPSSSCLEVAVDGSLSVYVWARAALVLEWAGQEVVFFSFQSSVITLVENLGPWELLPPTCIPLADIQNGKTPMTVSRKVSPEENLFFRLGPAAALSVASGGLQAAETIVAALVTDERSVMSTAEASTYALQSRILQLEPHGTSFNNDVLISLEVDISSWDSTMTTEDFCSSLFVISKADDSSPWVASDSTTLDCSALPTVTISSRSFSYYAVSTTNVTDESARAASSSTTAEPTTSSSTTTVTPAPTSSSSPTTAGSITLSSTTTSAPKSSSTAEPQAAASSSTKSSSSTTAEPTSTKSSSSTTAEPTSTKSSSSTTAEPTSTKSSSSTTAEPTTSAEPTTLAITPAPALTSTLSTTLAEEQPIPSSSTASGADPITTSRSTATTSPASSVSASSSQPTIADPHSSAFAASAAAVISSGPTSSSTATTTPTPSASTTTPAPATSSTSTRTPVPSTSSSSAPASQAAFSSSSSTTPMPVPTTSPSSAGSLIPTTAASGGMGFSVEATLAFVGNVSDFDQGAFQDAVSAAAGVDASRVLVNEVRAVPAARRKDSMVEIDFAILYPSAESAQQGAAQLTEETLNREFQSAGLPAATLVASPRVIERLVPETTAAPRAAQDEDPESDSGPNVPLIVGLTCGIGGALLAVAAGFLLGSKCLQPQAQEPTKQEPESGGDAATVQGHIVTQTALPAGGTDLQPSLVPGVLHLPAASHNNTPPPPSLNAPGPDPMQQHRAAAAPPGWGSPQAASLSSSWMLPAPQWPRSDIPPPPTLVGSAPPVSAWHLFPAGMQGPGPVVVSQVPAAQLQLPVPLPGPGAAAGWPQVPLRQDGLPGPMWWGHA